MEIKDISDLKVGQIVFFNKKFKDNDHVEWFRYRNVSDMWSLKMKINRITDNSLRCFFTNDEGRNDDVIFSFAKDKLVTSNNKFIYKQFLM